MQSIIRKLAEYCKRCLGRRWTQRTMTSIPSDVEIPTQTKVFDLNTHPEFLQIYEPDTLFISDERGFRYNTTGSAIVYTDGSCLANGRDNPLASIGVFFGPLSKLNVSRKLPSVYTPSNNCAEIVAVTTAFRLCKNNLINKIELRTDSKYLIECILQHVPVWLSNGWTKTNGKPVVNATELKELLAEKAGMEVIWVHVPGHSHDAGNRYVDFLARMATINEFIKRQEFLIYPQGYFKNIKT